MLKEVEIAPRNPNPDSYKSGTQALNTHLNICCFGRYIAQAKLCEVQRDVKEMFRSPTSIRELLTRLVECKFTYEPGHVYPAMTLLVAKRN
jgi:hypothetical protein